MTPRAFALAVAVAMVATLLAQAVLSRMPAVRAAVEGA